ncbi:putative membrane protein, partial [Acinetobacter baumannii 1406589]
MNNSILTKAYLILIAAVVLTGCGAEAAKGIAIFSNGVLVISFIFFFLSLISRYMQGIALTLV